MPGPRPSYGAVGQPVLPPPRQQPTNLAELDAIPYLPPAKLQQCATLAGMGATRAQLAAYFRPRVTAASSPWNDAVEQGFYDSMRLIHAHLSLNDLASLAMEMQDRDRTASVLRWIDEIDSLESVSPRWSTGSTVATKFDSEANWRTTPESSLSSPPPPPGKSIDLVV
ncbi:MAG: hypothetical protein L6R39_004021, partial [Caloplaca ligustica]